ncbi:MAG: hypothetical protein OEU92_34935 [Alphaproteobacteria bacterium]|nr:hypothetical protein [Alphaproteobacteria bacterium]
MGDIEEVLIALKADRFELGAAWKKAHELAQRHEGVARYDRLHALLQRIEGDLASAAYWYRRSGEPVFEGDVMEEADLLIERAR